MDVGFHSVWIIQRPNSEKTYGITGTRIVTPECNLARVSTKNILSTSAIGRYVYGFSFTFKQFYVMSFDKCI